MLKKSQSKTKKHCAQNRMKASGYGNWQEKRSSRVSIDFFKWKKLKSKEINIKTVHMKSKGQQWSSGQVLSFPL